MFIVLGSYAYSAEMCVYYMMFFTKNGQKTFFNCAGNKFSSLFDDIPAGNDVPLPPDPYLDSVASGQVHKGIES